MYAFHRRTKMAWPRSMAARSMHDAIRAWIAAAKWRHRSTRLTWTGTNARVICASNRRKEAARTLTATGFRQHVEVRPTSQVEAHIAVGRTSSQTVTSDRGRQKFGGDDLIGHGPREPQ